MVARTKYVTIYFARKCSIENRLPTNTGNNKSQFMKIHMRHHAIASNHLILETKH